MPDNKFEQNAGAFNKIFVFVALVFLAIIIAVVLGYAYYLTEISKPVPHSNKIVELTINDGDSVSSVANLLYKKGLIKHPLILRVYMYLNKDKVIQAGYYRINTENLDLVKLVDVFQKGSFEQRLTFIEGWRVEEYRDYLAKAVNDEFANKFINSKFVREGYMFPDTYIIERGYSPEDLASWMRNNFDKKVTSDLIDKAGLRGLSLEEVVILASIVEREMAVKADRPKVAGILIKRWRKGWPLQVDATVQYVKGSSNNWWPKVSRDWLRTVKSPYNTYLNKGLPPGPISNPGLNAIESVVNYVETPYWFYMTGKDGITRYAKTLEEHNRNISKYL